MHSSSLLFTVLLASAVKDIDCLPTSELASKLAPQANNIVKLATGGSGRAFSSYRGPFIPETGREAVAIIDAKEGNHPAVTNLRDSGLYSKVHAVLQPGVKSLEAVKFKENQAQMTKTRWEAGGAPFMQSPLNVIKANEAHMSPKQHSLHQHIHPETKYIDVYPLTSSGNKDAEKVVDGIRMSGRKVNVVHNYRKYLEEHRPKGTAEEQHLRNLGLNAHEADMKYKIELLGKNGRHGGQVMETNVNDRHDMFPLLEKSGKTNIDDRHELVPSSSFIERQNLASSGFEHGSEQVSTTNVNNRHDLVPSFFASKKN